MLLTRVARTAPLGSATPVASWARALAQRTPLVPNAATSAGETTASRACVAFAPKAERRRSSFTATRRGLATYASSQTPPSEKKAWKPRKDKTKAALKREEEDGRRLQRATPTAPKAGASDAWRKPFEEFERRVHVHGAEAGYSAADVFSVVKVCVVNGRHREAQTVVRRARGLGVVLTPQTHAEMCAIQARKGHVDAAFDTLRELLVASSKKEKQGSKRSVVEDAKLFDPLLSVLKDQHDWQSVRRAVQLMHEFEIEPPIRVFRVFMIAAAKARKKDVLLKTVAFVETKFRDEPVDLATLTAMCQALTEVGETRNVLDRYHTMDQAWLEANGTTILFNNFVLAALRGGRVNKAIEIFERMKVSETFAPDDFTFATCILEFEKRREWDQVIRFFNEMLDREMKGISHAQAINALSCAAVVRALHNRDKSDDDTEDGTVSRSPSAKRAIDSGMRVVLQRLDRVEIRNFGHAASLVDALEEHGFRAEAQRLFERMVDTPNVFKAPWLRQQGYEVDLHSFSRGVAKCAVVHAFQQVRARAAIKKVDDMRVVTGVGRRSKEFLLPVVPDDVTQLLLRSFRPLIRPMAHPTNPGVLLIRSKFIQQWLAEGAEIRHFE